MTKVIYRIPVKQHTYGNGKVTVWHGGELTMNYTTQHGKFDYASSEESYSCHIAVYEDGKRLMSSNVTPEYEYNDNDVSEAMWLLKEEAKRYWIDTSASEKKALMKFLERHTEEIEMGNGKKRLLQIDKDMESLASEKERLLRWVK